MGQTLLERIKNAQIDARKEKDTFRTNILTSLYSECKMYGKNNGNRLPTDNEVIKVIQKFKKNCTDTYNMLFKKNNNKYSDKLNELEKEIKIYDEFLPTQLSENELRKIVHNMIIQENFNNIGQIMRELKDKYDGQFDGKQASKIVQEELKGAK